MWAAEQITDVESAKRVAIEIQKELTGLVDEEDLLPTESQPPTPGELSRHLLTCSKPNMFQYPGSTGLLFRDEASAKSFERKIHEHIRSQDGWDEQLVQDGTEDPQLEFTSNNGFTVTATEFQHSGVHRVMILVFSPCFEMPAGFQQSVDQF